MITLVSTSTLLITIALGGVPKVALLTKEWVMTTSVPSGLTIE